MLELLEDRTAPASMTFTVLTTKDTGAGSLRQAILNANAHVSATPDVIRFASTLVNTGIRDWSTITGNVDASSVTNAGGISFTNGERFFLTGTIVAQNAIAGGGPADDDQKLEKKHPRKAELVKLRFFAGLTNEQAAGVLGVSTSTADNDWAYARSWLRVPIAADASERP